MQKIKNLKERINLLDDFTFVKINYLINKGANYLTISKLLKLDIDVSEEIYYNIEKYYDKIKRSANKNVQKPSNNINYKNTKKEKHNEK